MAAAAGKLLIRFANQLNSSPPRLIISAAASAALPLAGVTSPKPRSKVLESAVAPLRASLGKDSKVQAGVEDDDGVSLATMKLPANTDIPLFETLLFQWANSLCQGANLPLPVPLKVDKVEGGARLGFIEIDNGKTEVFAYIDCLVFPATGNSGPLFRATRNGPMKDQTPPGEPRIMRSLLQALQKSVQIASS
ncbi:uncharacterized protein LOC121987258 [Zingiber officinale]|uniref:DUF7148 domain-containing protein n=1 Tax=Zingiber officinale TaxID=94328 RepID=A0A8J5L6X4_ZINOF|nr:uncharacterized protein LOC121987258 [Zingiber officinale]KAG6502870.1 hypothetical protein ZIOFF_035159 [Zingiber officinale]